MENQMKDRRLRLDANITGYTTLDLKDRPLEPELVGKLNYYVNAVDELMKASDENPTIGLLACSGMDKIDVQCHSKASAPYGSCNL